MKVGKGGDQRIACNPDGLRGEKLLVKSQRCNTPEFNEGYERIKWGKPKKGRSKT